MLFRKFPPGSRTQIASWLSENACVLPRSEMLGCPVASTLEMMIGTLSSSAPLIAVFISSVSWIKVAPSSADGIRERAGNRGAALYLVQRTVARNRRGFAHG